MLILLVWPFAPALEGAGEQGWIDLIQGVGLKAWQEPTAEWLVAGEVGLKPGEPTRLAWKPGTGCLVNGSTGKTRNILSTLMHGDCEAHVEFMVPKNSNSGVYFMGRYEIQVFDSWDDTTGAPKEHPKHSDCGGIYQRWQDGRGFEGRPPRVNAARKYGQWQSFDVVFLAPRFDREGKKTANAEFVSVRHNGTLIHQNQEVTGPTRAATYTDEQALGPLMLQGDHGPVAYRTIRIRPLQVVAEETCEAIKEYEQGKGRAALAALEAATRRFPPRVYPQIETKLLEVLQSAEATVAGKRFACRMLRRIGSDRCVSVLSKLLADEKLAHMARFALQRLPVDRVDAVFREALGTLEGRLKIGVVGSVGERGDREAIPALAKLTGSDDVALAAAALRALGRIGGTEAARALAESRVARELRDLKADSLLSCAEALLRAGKAEESATIYGGMTGPSVSPMARIAAYRGLVMAEREKAVPRILQLLKAPNRSLRQAAAKFISELPGRETTEALAAQLSSLDAETQQQLLSALKARGDKAAAPAVAELAQHSDPTIALPAVEALGVLGGPPEVPLLASLAAAGRARGTVARESLDRLSGSDITRALMDVADSDDPAVRRVVFKALGHRAGQAEYPDLVAMLVTKQDSADRRYLQQALIAAAGRVEDSDVAASAIVAGLKLSDHEATISFLGVLPGLGGAKALETLRKYLTSSDPKIKQVALLALLDWRSADAIPDLLDLAEKDPDESVKGLAFRGVIHKLRLLQDRSDTEARARFERALTVAPRAEDRRFIIRSLPVVPAPWSLSMAKQYRTDPKLGPEAEKAHQKILAVLNDMFLIEAEGILTAKEATIHGSGAAYEPASNRDCIGVWNNAAAWVSWDVLIQTPGVFSVEVSQSMAGEAGSTYSVGIGDQQLTGTVKETGNWARFETVVVGTVEIKEAGTYTVAVKPIKKLHTYVMNLRSVTLRRK